MGIEPKIYQRSANKKNAIIALIVLLALSLSGAILAKAADSGFGSVQVEKITIYTAEYEPMSAKIYRPMWVDAEHPAPGLLALHGYQSDKEATTTFGTIELARRGFVVLSIDQYGHGASTTHPVDGEIMSGAENGLNYLAKLPFVESNRLGTYGHSTGSIYATTLAAKHPDIVKAVVALSGNGGDEQILKVNNYLLVQGDAEEIGPYREGTFPVSSLTRHPARLAAFGMSENDEIEWNHTYGDFSDGSARRAELVSGTHLGVMVGRHSNQVVVDWFNDALRNGDQDSHWIASDSQIYLWKEIGGAIALFALLATIVPLTSLLLRTRLLHGAIGEEEKLPAAPKKRLATVMIGTIILTMIFYPFFTQKGGGKEPISKVFKLMPLQMGNGIIMWLLMSTLVAGICAFIWLRRNSCSWQEIGVLRAEGSNASWIGRGALLSAGLIGWMAFVVAAVNFFGGPEFRVLWPMLKVLTPQRVLILPIYFVLIFCFFFAVNGLNLHVIAHIPESGSMVRTWAKRVLFAWISALGGLIVLFCFHFIPDFLGYGPGFDLVGLKTYGGRWMMMLFVIIPQFAALIMINVWMQLRTRSIWVASFVGAAIFTWMMVGGQVGAF